MPSPTPASGRHRAPAVRRARSHLVPRLRRPGHRALLKTTGGLVAAVGVVSAWTGPVSAMPGFDLADATTSPAAATVKAPRTALAAPSWGQIGFEATARPKPKPKPKPKPAAAAKADRLTADRTETAASRGIRRSGLRGELGLTQNGLVVLNAIRDNFPQVTSYGGFRPGDMDHGTGSAVDAMVSSRGTGDAVAAYVMDHAAELNVKYIIWYQRIWYPSSGTWKPMEDRGGFTANHMDHVHVSVN